MNAHSNEHTNTGGNAFGGAQDLQRLSDCGDLQVADGHPDIRGWSVQTRDGQTIGKVHDLIVSTGELRARYLDVDVKDRGHALMPVGTAEIDDDNDIVYVNSVSGADFEAYPRYMRSESGGKHIDADYERTVRQHVQAGDTYEHDSFDDQRLYGARSKSTGSESIVRRPVQTDSVRDLQTGGRGLADRTADALDDLKDRVDGNPSSRPGRDATDRPSR